MNVAALSIPTEKLTVFVIFRVWVLFIPLVTTRMKALGALQVHDALGPEHKKSSEVIDRIIALYEDWGKPDQAAKWRLKLPAGHEIDDEGRQSP